MKSRSQICSRHIYTKEKTEIKQGILKNYHGNLKAGKVNLSCNRPWRCIGL
jgi:hypothetical protein